MSTNFHNGYNIYNANFSFFENIDRISEKSYVPNDQDILRTRVSTTGITEIEFNMKDALVRYIGFFVLARLRVRSLNFLLHKIKFSNII